MSLLERVFYFHQQILKDKFPNSTSIAEQFEVSIPTSKRDINYLRDRLLAPLVFNSSKNGYHYGQEGFNLPFEDSPKIVFLLAMLGKLAEEAGLGKLKEVRQLETRLSKMISADYSKVMDSLEVQRIEVESIDHTIFETVIESLVSGKLLLIEYRAVGGEEHSRSVAPVKIINYQGRWYLLSYCMLRKDDRLFHMSRIQKACVQKELIPEEVLARPRAEHRSFGIFQSSPQYTAKILFTSTAAELVRNQRWHADQKMEITEDGIRLELPVGDDREILLKVLQYGAMARVLSPKRLIERVKEEVDKMHAAYTP
jgi:predicted DNA-binding transcriptional regulator YafY